MSHRDGLSRTPFFTLFWEVITSFSSNSKFCSSSWWLSSSSNFNSSTSGRFGIEDGASTISFSRWKEEEEIVPWKSLCWVIAIAEHVRTTSRHEAKIIGVFFFVWKKQERNFGESNQNQSIKALSARVRFPALSAVEESRHRDGSIVQNVTTEKIEDAFSKNISLHEVFIKPCWKFSFFGDRTRDPTQEGAEKRKKVFVVLRSDFLSERGGIFVWLPV